MFHLYIYTNRDQEVFSKSVKLLNYLLHFKNYIKNLYLNKDLNIW